jgi:soluble lytic murein transglycosylase-like protein
MIDAAGRAHDLPLEFFARVIWQESRFRPDTMGPLRRDGQRAQGIAQFMPSTAAERGLLDPFDPVQALPRAAQFLRELKDQFGNLGLAAAAYNAGPANAGPARVRAWLAGTHMLPGETRNHVAAVTGVPPTNGPRAVLLSLL